jgi:hypothetical protein
MSGTLTAADAVLTISQPILFPTPQQIQGFAADDVTDMDSAKILEHLMGVDGVLSFGFVFVERMQKIVLQANSDSNALFDTVNTQQEAAETVYPLAMTIILPSIGLMWTCINGGLENYKPMPGVKKILQPREYRIVWNKVVPSLYAGG